MWSWLLHLVPFDFSHSDREVSSRPWLMLVMLIKIVSRCRWKMWSCSSVKIPLKNDELTGHQKRNKTSLQTWIYAKILGHVEWVLWGKCDSNWDIRKICKRDHCDKAQIKLLFRTLLHIHFKSLAGLIIYCTIMTVSCYKKRVKIN